MKISDFFGNIFKPSRRKIRATAEAGRDVLTPNIAKTASSLSKVVDKNNYKTYSACVVNAYDNYNSKTDYGSEIFRGLLDTRVSLIAGEGLSITAQTEQGKEFIKKFVEYNKLNGSRLIQFAETGEMEGKNLLLLMPDKQMNCVYVKSVLWYEYPYNISIADDFMDKLKKITYKKKNSQSEEQEFPLERTVYVKIGGTVDELNNTISKMHCVLTDVENYSRSKYDLRKNAHLFARVTPYFKTQDQQSAKIINNAISSREWEIGNGYAGIADFSMIGPPGGAVEILIKDMLTALKNISTTTGIPVHWLAYPELMSNRATAENLLEVVNASTRKDRLIWEESFKEVIRKAAVLAVDQLGYDNRILDEVANYQVKLPLVSLANLKQLIEVWQPILADGLISRATFQNMLPSINPDDENKQIEIEKEQNAKESPFNNKTIDDTLNKMQGENEDAESYSDEK